MQACPFQPGDWVIYQPTTRGRGHVIMTDLAQLQPGKKYKVAGIENDEYVVIEGFENSPGGGLYWKEFVPLQRG
ncbi:MAG TPA: hypothetical protein VJM12_20435 [Pyrinomonadaceae bacterium]|nr:hypothetical protein [Pyrinomonadaceae bacterium]